MKGLNLSKMKKISQDNNRAVFKHDDGHEINVALKALSPEMRKSISSLPQHMAEGSMSADKSGGEESNQEQPVPTPQAPVVINVGGGQPPVQQGKSSSQEAEDNISTFGGAIRGYEKSPAPPEWINAPAAPTAQDVMSMKPINKIAPEQEQGPGLAEGLDKSAAPQQARAPAIAPMKSSQPAPDSLAPQSVGNVQPPPGAEAPVDKGQLVKQDLSDEQKAWEHDLINQHVTPKTYSDLFANKSTLGKIGTLFGLIVGGAGAGLTGQANPVMEMMDKQISKDLEGQKESKGNAQNFLKINMQHEMNNAQKELMQKQGHLTDANIKQTQVETQIKAYTLAQSQMLQASYHSLVQNVNKMPEGPQKEAAKQQLGVIYSKIGEKINNLNDQAAGATTYYNNMFGSQNSDGANEEQKFQNKTTGMMMFGPQGEARAKDLRARHVSGVPEIEGQSSSREVPEGDRKQIEAMQVLSNKGRDLLKFAQQHKGSLDPKTRALGEQKAEEMMNFYNSSIQPGGTLTAGRMEWLDKQIGKNPTSIFQDVLGNNAKLKEIVSSNEGRKHTLLKSLGYTPSEIRYDAQGNAWKKGPDGKAVRVK